jgi:hypothetical protein
MFPKPSSDIPDACQVTVVRASPGRSRSRRPLRNPRRLDFIKVQLARLPTRNKVWRAAMLGILGGAVLP